MRDESTFEGRTQCPRCEVPGVIELKQTHLDKTQSFSITCMNERCVWFGINWLVDRNSDGTVPMVRPHRKAYPTLPGMDDITARVQAAADAEIARAMKPHE